MVDWLWESVVTHVSDWFYELIRKTLNFTLVYIIPEFVLW